MDAEVATALVCVECKTVSEGDARGWRFYLTDDEPAETAGPYCPECAAREFGSDKPCVATD